MITSATAVLCVAGATAGDVVQVPADFTTIQSAIDASQAGDEIVVAPGVYEEHIAILATTLTVRSSGGADVTTINGSGSPGRVVDILTNPDDSIELAGFTITGGVAGDGDFGGGGLHMIGIGPVVVRDCRFVGNRAEGALLNGLGGGATCSGNNPLFINCEFLGNEASIDGCGFACYEGTATLINCTFTANIVPEGTTVTAWDADVQMHNCIAWGNDSTSELFAGAIVASHSIVEGGVEGIANIDADPRFMREPSAGVDSTWGTSDDDWGDLRVQPFSPAIDAGDNTLLPVGTTTDMAGLMRTVDGDADSVAIVDIGAHERQRVGDLDSDGSVNIFDLVDALGAWGDCPKPCPPSCAADITNADGTDTDCTVNVFDLLAVLSNWG